MVSQLDIQTHQKFAQKNDCLPLQNCIQLGFKVLNDGEFKHHDREDETIKYKAVIMQTTSQSVSPTFTSDGNNYTLRISLFQQ